MGEITMHNQPLAEVQLKKLIESNLTNSADHSQVTVQTLKTSEDFMAEAYKKRCQELEVKLQDQVSTLDHHHKCLAYIYNCFKVRSVARLIELLGHLVTVSVLQSLKANPKYLKQIFGDELMDKFKDLSVLKEGDNLVQNIFSG